MRKWPYSGPLRGSKKVPFLGCFLTVFRKWLKMHILAKNTCFWLKTVFFVFFDTFMILAKMCVFFIISCFFMNVLINYKIIINEFINHKIMMNEFINYKKIYNCYKKFYNVIKYFLCVIKILSVNEKIL